jgi:hypothetical protein
VVEVLPHLQVAALEAEKLAVEENGLHRRLI